VEREALEFMGEFLLPEDDMQQEFAGDDPITLTRLAELKGKWGVSIQIILFRLEQLEIIAPQKKSYWRGRLDKLGWLDNEPVPIPSDNPVLLRQMLEKAYGAPVDTRAFAREMGIPSRFCTDLLQANGREAFTVGTPERVDTERTDLDKEAVPQGTVLMFRK